MHAFFSDKQRWTDHDVAGMLVSRTPLTSLTFDEALEIVGRMTPRRVKAGAVLLEEGAKDDDFLLFVLAGEALVQTGIAEGDPIVLGVVSEGSVLGEQAVIDSDGRSATVTALTDMVLAVMDEAALAKLVHEKPAIACDLMASMLQAVSRRLRLSNRKIRMLTKINRSLHEELGATRELPDGIGEMLRSGDGIDTMR